jgi:hypothetical protein
MQKKRLIDSLRVARSPTDLGLEVQTLKLDPEYIFKTLDHSEKLEKTNSKKTMAKSSHISKNLISTDFEGKAKTIDSDNQEAFSRALELARALEISKQDKDLTERTEKFVADRYKLAHLREPQWGLKGKYSKQKSISSLESFKRAFIVFLRRLINWAQSRFMQRKHGLTTKGKLALAYLEELYNLMLLDAFDGKQLLALKMAYGSACYQVLHASRTHNVRKSSPEDEDYSNYFDQFLRTVKA